MIDLELIYDNLGVAKFKVIGGEFNNKIVQIIYAPPIILSRYRDKFKVKDFDKDVLDGIGILNYQGNPVNKEVLDRFNLNVKPDNCLYATTGVYTEDGWCNKEITSRIT